GPFCSTLSKRTPKILLVGINTRSASPSSYPNLPLPSARLPYAPQLIAFLPRNRGELRLFDLAIAEVYHFDRFARWRLPNQIHQLALFSHQVAVEAGDDIAAHQASLICGRARWLDALEGHSAFSGFESIDAENGTIQKYSIRCSPPARAFKD